MDLLLPARNNSMFPDPPHPTFISDSPNEEIHEAIRLWHLNRNDAEERYGDIRDWDVSNITDMSALFINYPGFNEDISNWNVSNVTNMRSMFRRSNAFNQDIRFWDVSKVTDMSYMFNGAAAFDQYIGGWSVSNVTNHTGMFTNSLMQRRGLTENMPKFKQMGGKNARHSQSRSRRRTKSNRKNAARSKKQRNRKSQHNKSHKAKRTTRSR